MKLIIQIPCFNEEASLAPTLAEIPRHIPGVDEVRVLVIDDGSTDHTREVVARYGDKLTYLYHENRGEAASTNRGWQLATGDYFAMVSSDDPMLPGWLSKAVEYMECNPEAIVGYPDWKMIDLESKTIQEMKVYEYDVERLIG